MNLNYYFNQLTKAEKNTIYAFTTKPLLNKHALFSDNSKYYMNPSEPELGEDVTVKFRTAKDNVDAVYVVHSGQKDLMKRCTSDKLFDYYESVIPAKEGITEYYFEIHSGRLVCFYNKKGVSKDLETFYNFKISLFYK